ncbi:hypothetical protein MOF7_21530 [Methylobacterium oryzae]
MTEQPQGGDRLGRRAGIPLSGIGAAAAFISRPRCCSGRGRWGRPSAGRGGPAPACGPRRDELNPADLATHRFPLADGPGGYDLFKH